MSCCPPGSIGPAPLANKEQKGKMIALMPKEDSKRKELPMYIVGQEEAPCSIVVVFTDVYGIESGNQKVFCDALSERLDSSLVIMPDLFRGNPIMGSWGLPHSITNTFAIPSIVWSSKTRMKDTAIETDLLEVILPFLNKFETAKISMVGFCYGAWVMGRGLALEQLSHLKCGVAIHPSWKIEQIHGKTETALAAAVKDKPILFLVANNDDLKVGTPIIQQLSKQRGNIDENTISIEFQDMVHGFVARGDANDPKIAEQQEKVLHLTADFIKVEEAK
jgi:dienelactone hydrolase